MTYELLLRVRDEVHYEQGTIDPAPRTPIDKQQEIMKANIYFYFFVRAIID